MGPIQRVIRGSGVWNITPRASSGGGSLVLGTPPAGEMQWRCTGGTLGANTAFATVANILPHGASNLTAVSEWRQARKNVPFVFSA